MKTIDHTYGDAGGAVEHLINLIIDSKVNTTLPAEVVEVKKDKVSVRSLVMPKEADVPPVVFHNIMAVMPAGGGVRLYHPLKPGDQGLLVTCKLDMIEFKKSLAFAKTKTGRTFDLNDSVFIPLLFNKRELTKEDVTLVYNEEAGDDAAKVILTEEGIEVRGKTKMSIKNGQAHITLHDNRISIVTQGKGEVEVQGDVVDLKCERLRCAPLKGALDAVQDLMDQLSKGLKGSGSNPAEYLAKKPTHLGAFMKIDE